MRFVASLIAPLVLSGCRSGEQATEPLAAEKVTSSTKNATKIAVTISDSDGPVELDTKPSKTLPKQPVIEEVVIPTPTETVAPVDVKSLESSEVRATADEASTSSTVLEAPSVDATADEDHEKTSRPSEIFASPEEAAEELNDIIAEIALINNAASLLVERITTEATKSEVATEEEYAEDFDSDRFSQI